MKKLLAYLGLAFRSELIETQNELSKYKTFAERASGLAGERGDVVICEGETVIQHSTFINRCVFVPPGVKGVMILGCHFRDEALPSVKEIMATVDSGKDSVL